MPLYYFFAGLLLFASLIVLGVKLTKLNKDSSIPGRPGNKPESKGLDVLKAIGACVLYSLLILAPSLAAAQNWIRLVLGLALVWLALDSLIEAWREVMDLKKYREGLRLGKAKDFLPEPGAIAVGFMFITVQFVLVVAASAIVYL